MIRYSKLTVFAVAFTIAACGGGGDQANQPPATPAPTPTPAPAGGTPAPITGTVHKVEMILDAQGQYRFDPAAITIKAGDGIRFEFVSGGPHNVAFDPAQFTANPAAKAALIANMPAQEMGELSGKMMVAPGETYTISFANVPAGKYEANCTPHLAMNMKIMITVQ